MISVILPSYNREAVIYRSLLSALDQTYDPVEVIVWDDGSSDGTLEKVKGITDSRIRVYSASNRGVAGARNQAVTKARGEWIAFLDSDDEWLPEKLETQIHVLKQYPYLDFIFTSAYRGFDASGNYLVTIPEQGISSFGFKLDQLGDQVYEIKENLAESIFNFALTIPTVLIRKSTFEKVGRFNESLRNSEDREFWWRVILSGAKVAVITKPLVRIHQSEENLSAYSKTYLEHHLHSLKLMVKTAEQKGRHDLIPMIEKRWQEKGIEYINMFYKEITFRNVMRYLPKEIYLSASFQLLKRRLSNSVY